MSPDGSPAARELGCVVVFTIVVCSCVGLGLGVLAWVTKSPSVSSTPFSIATMLGAGLTLWPLERWIAPWFEYSPGGRFDPVVFWSAPVAGFAVLALLLAAALTDETALMWSALGIGGLWILWALARRRAAD